jgi:hypothetical protein
MMYDTHLGLQSDLHEVDYANGIPALSLKVSQDYHNLSHHGKTHRSKSYDQ